MTLHLKDSTKFYLYIAFYQCFKMENIHSNSGLWIISELITEIPARVLLTV